MTALPTAQTSISQVLASYLYQEYSDSDDLQAFAAAYNSLAQGYLDWFNATPLGLYTSPNITGPLLDWIGLGLYGIERPVIGTYSGYSIGEIASFFVGQLPIAASRAFSTGSATPVNDDIYKRVLTWWLYRGDGKNMSIDWIKRRVARFMYGENGTDIAYPVASPPSVTLSYGGGAGAVASFPVGFLPVAGNSFTTAGTFTIGVPDNSVGQALQALVAINALALPFENSFVVALGDPPW